MILLDENIRQDQAIQLRRHHIPARFLVEDFTRTGIQDPDIIPLLHRLKQPAFFTHDRDFFRRGLAHQNYCLVWLDIFDGEAAEFIRAFLKCELFDTAAKRAGIVARVHQRGDWFLAAQLPIAPTVTLESPDGGMIGSSPPILFIKMRL